MSAELAAEFDLLPEPYAMALANDLAEQQQRDCTDRLPTPFTAYKIAAKNWLNACLSKPLANDFDTAVADAFELSNARYLFSIANSADADYRGTAISRPAPVGMFESEFLNLPDQWRAALSQIAMQALLTGTTCDPESEIAGQYMAHCTTTGDHEGIRLAKRLLAEVAAQRMPVQIASIDDSRGQPRLH